MKTYILKTLVVLFVCCTITATAHCQYKTVRIGSSLWMAENLDVNVPGSWYYNEDATLGKKYGRLYTWEAAKNACPSGWHLPSDDEWTELTNVYGGEDVALKELKPEGASGFNARLGGFADGHSFRFIDGYGGYWTSTKYDGKHAWYRYLSNRDNSTTKTYFNKTYGVSVRCVKNGKASDNRISQVK